MDSVKNINVDSINVFRPVISATLLNAYFSSLILKKLSGLEITPELEDETLTDLFHKFDKIEDVFSEALKRHVQQGE